MENQLSVPAEVQVIMAKQQAEFALTPVGQMLKEFEAQQRIATLYANSALVPATLKGDPSKEFGTPEQKATAAFNKTLANCVIAMNMATRMKADPLMVMQNLYIVHGQPAFSSKFLIACINACGKYASLRFEFKGQEGTEEYGCRAYTYEVSDTKHKEPLYGEWITMGMAKKEGWTSKNGSKWQTMPGQMLRYRAAAFFQRTYCPEISMGLSTTEEVQDAGPSGFQPYVEEVKSNDLSSLALARMKKEAQPKPEPEQKDAEPSFEQPEEEMAPKAQEPIEMPQQPEPMPEQHPQPKARRTNSLL